MPSTAIAAVLGAAPANFVWHEVCGGGFEQSWERKDPMGGDLYVDWLQSSLDDRSIFLFPNKQWIRFNASVAEPREPLHTEYYEYEQMAT
ncbi:hypothetical protein FDECE_14056 [Fusarium decemcellulare]|nr:hypothetical protein FDECE_14056 [Fusarium decemcellulare]